MDLLKEGQKLSINIQKESHLVEIIGTIEKVLDDRLFIELPPYFMRYIEYLDTGKLLTIKVFSKLGTIDFNTIVISSPLENDTLVIELDYNALKLTTSEKMPVIDTIVPIKIILSDKNTITTQTFQISTEYIKFYSENKFNINESFDCQLLLSKDYGTIKCKITIVEIDKVYDNEYTATYYYMSEQDRETLLYYMYEYSNNVN